MKKQIVMAALLALGLQAGLGAEAVAKVGGERISREEFEAKVQMEEAGLKRKLSPQERAGLLRSIANQRLLVAEARRRKLDRDPGLKAFLAETERKALADQVYQAEVASKAQVTAEDAKRFYEQNPQAFEVAQVGQIFVAVQPGKEAEAERKAAALKAKLDKAPKSFAALAKAESDDPESKAKGGDLGSLRHGVLVQAVDQAVFTAKAPAILGPIRSPQGFHILQVRSVRRLGWSEVSAGLPTELQRAESARLQAELIERLSKKDKVSLYEDKL